MEDQNNQFAHIKGWGIDADPENDPTYPMKRYNGDDHKRLSYQAPPPQPLSVEVLHSNERPSVSAVFGTSVPPSGLSGKIRRYAFNYSEGSFGHWIPLLLADRVNVVEGIVDDLKQGHVPNIFAEWGWKAEWKHSPTRLIGKVVLCTVATAALIALCSGKKKGKKAVKAMLPRR
ncbi:hypothetical protein [uncultured Chitinophaga sp.]|jgi:hypothetical protein|uniref:hypothetical protein n=1 Tax=uncultured Chitinophaga sp. TaxID=339340 RepID=UPI0026322F7F|nr:hypothetical protein [uncultured Chitinophaga sp.]